MTLNSMCDMTTLHFHKFDGAGNDFIVIDARQEECLLSKEQIAYLCHRRFGIGADGLMTLSADPDGNFDFVMHYYNSDGGEASMCGNGGRCIALFAHRLGLSHADRVRFLASDGPHDAEILHYEPYTGKGVVRLGMCDVKGVERRIDGWLLNTGVPHYVQQVSDLDHFDIRNEGRRLRFHPELGSEGANVDFVESDGEGVLHIRTYERGVEDETWACGTGVTAAALVTGCHRVKALGGDFVVDFHPINNGFDQVMLTGPASFNFKGEIAI